MVSWYGLYAPKGMSPVLASRIHEEVSKVVHSPEMLARFATLGAYAGSGSPSDFAVMVAKETTRWSRLAKERGIKAE